VVLLSHQSHSNYSHRLRQLTLLGIRSAAIAVAFLVGFLPCGTSLAWDGNWVEAPSGDYMYDPNDSQGKSGVSPDPRTYYTAAPRDYADVDPEELSDYYGRGRRPDYAPYALARITQTLHYGKDITIPIGYYLIKAGDPGDGSPKAHDPNGSSGDKTLQDTGPKKKTGGAARPTGSIDPGAYPDTTGYLAVVDEIAQATSSPGFPQSSSTLGNGTRNSNTQGEPVEPSGSRSTWETTPEENSLNVTPSLEGLESMSSPSGDGNGNNPAVKPLRPGAHRVDGPIRKFLPPSLFDP
jgi:hypothetical protein